MKRICSVVLSVAFVMVLFSGCGAKNNFDLSGDGGYWGDSVSEGEEEVLLSVLGGLGCLNKQTEEFSYLCKNPACKHEHGSCISGHFTSQIRRAGNGFCFFDVPNATFYLLDDKGRETELYQLPQEQDETMAYRSPALIYDNTVCYTERAEEKGNSSFVLTNLDSRETKTFPVTHLVTFFIPFEHDFYFLTSEMELYRVSMDGGEEEKVSREQDKIISIRITGGKIYYINQNADAQGLYRMELDGSGKEQLYEGQVDSFAVEGEDIYFSEETLDGSLTCWMKTDKTGLKKILNQTSYVYLFASWDRVLYQTEDETYFLMDRDGSNQKKLTMYRLNG